MCCNGDAKIRYAIAPVEIKLAHPLGGSNIPQFDAGASTASRYKPSRRRGIYRFWQDAGILGGVVRGGVGRTTRLPDAATFNFSMGYWGRSVT